MLDGGEAWAWRLRRSCSALSLSAIPSRPAPAEFVYDLSSRLIAITTAFAGTQVLLYGAAPASGGAIAVVVRGPTRDTTVRRKSRVGPIWLNTSSLAFRAVPSFYAVATSEPLDELAGPSTLARHELGAERLRLVPVEAEGLAADEIERFRVGPDSQPGNANGLFSAEPGTVSFLGDALFRTRIVFPANVPPGDYQVQVLQFADGEVTGAQTSTAGDREDGHRGRPVRFLAAPAGALCARLDRAGGDCGLDGQRAVSQAMTDE